MKTNCVMPFFSRETRCHVKTLCLLPRSYMADQYKTPYQLIKDPLPKSGRNIEIKGTKSLQQTQSYYNQHPRHLPDIRVDSRVALQHPQTKMWDIYGILVLISIILSKLKWPCSNSQLPLFTPQNCGILLSSSQRACNATLSAECYNYWCDSYT